MGEFEGWLKDSNFDGIYGKNPPQHCPKTILNPSVESTAGESKVHLAVTAAGSADRKTPPLADLCQCRTSKIGGRLRCCKSHFVLS